MTEMSRTEFLAWAKQRAINELDTEHGGGGIPSALASIGSDFRNHPELQNHDAPLLMMMMAMNGLLNTDAAVREFVAGIN